ncbi:NADPH-dependent F420 reductase [Streptosporangium lutulentum]|uniref:NADPH-dependent F420 reductase n=1 Tax=Streptosporangium lutulentum TaxID=1461250 RepID=UPI0027D82319|nr:NAD(P)-binding domain-containing protein [Streptosporangium lutulentum]
MSGARLRPRQGQGDRRQARPSRRLLDDKILSQHERKTAVKIGIIGTGAIGTNLVRKLTKAGHSVRVANSRGPETITDLATETGATAVAAADAGQDVDVLILSTPLGKVPDLKPFIDRVPDHVVIADTSNYYPFRDGKIDAIENGQAESVWVEECLGRPVIRAWNALTQHTLENKGAPKGTPGRLAIPVAGTDPAAKKTVSDLIDDTGFDAVDAGPIEDSWRIQPGSPAYCTELTGEQLTRALDLADRENDRLRREMVFPIVSTWPDAHGDDMVALVRAVARLPRLLGL